MVRGRGRIGASGRSSARHTRRTAASTQRWDGQQRPPALTRIGAEHELSGTVHRVMATTEPASRSRSWSSMTTRKVSGAHSPSICVARSRTRLQHRDAVLRRHHAGAPGRRPRRSRRRRTPDGDAEDRVDPRRVLAIRVADVERPPPLWNAEAWNYERWRDRLTRARSPLLRRSRQWRPRDGRAPADVDAARDVVEGRVRRAARRTRNVSALCHAHLHRAAFRCIMLHALVH